MAAARQVDTDGATAGYLLATAGLIVLFRQQVAGWAILAGLHLVGVALVMLLRWLSARAGAWRLLHDWYPLLTFPLFFKEVEFLAAAFDDWRLTETVRALEESLFGGQPSLYLSQAWPWVPLSEYLHFCYFSYVVMIPAVGAYWYATKRRVAFRELFLLLCLTLYGSYLFFIRFPVDSPFYLSPPLGAPFDQQFFYNLVHHMSSRGGARGGAFPSAHASGSLIIVLVAWKHQRMLAYLLLPVVAGILVATVYGRFHYVLDTIAGGALAVLVVVLYRRLDEYRQSRRKEDFA